MKKILMGLVVSLAIITLSACGKQGTEQDSSLKSCILDALDINEPNCSDADLKKVVDEEISSLESYDESYPDSLLVSHWYSTTSSVGMKVQYHVDETNRFELIEYYENIYVELYKSVNINELYIEVELSTNTYEMKLLIERDVLGNDVLEITVSNITLDNRLNGDLEFIESYDEFIKSYLEVTEQNKFLVLYVSDDPSSYSSDTYIEFYKSGYEEITINNTSNISEEQLLTAIEGIFDFNVEVNQSS